MSKTYEVQLLTTEGMYLYKVTKTRNELVLLNNPFGALILELRRREHEFLTGPPTYNPCSTNEHEINHGSPSALADD